MSGLFEHIAQFDDGQRVAGRQAAAVAQKRISDRFGSYLGLSKDSEERTARLGFIEDDLRQIVADVAEEYNADIENLQDAIDEHLKGEGVTDLNGDLEEAPSAVGHKSAGGHASDCDCGFCQNKGNLPGSDSDSDDDGDEDNESEAKESSASDPLAKTAVGGPEQYPAEQGATCDNCGAPVEHKANDYPCPNCGQPTLNVHPGLQQGLDSLIGLGSTKESDVVDPTYLSEAPAPEHHHPGVNEVPCPDCGGAGCPGCHGAGVIPLDPRQLQEGGPDTLAPLGLQASTKTAEADRDGGGAVTREKLPKGDGESIGTEPSPKIDKKQWKPNALNSDGNLEVIDSEQAGSPVPTETQDIADGAEYESQGEEGDGFLDGTDSVTEQQTLPTADESGQSTERNISQDGQDGTWTESENDPVTSEVLSNTEDPDKDALRTVLESGWPSDEQVQSAIRDYESQ